MTDAKVFWQGWGAVAWGNGGWGQGFVATPSAEVDVGSPSIIQGSGRSVAVTGDALAISDGDLSIVSDNNITVVGYLLTTQSGNVITSLPKDVVVTGIDVDISFGNANTLIYDRVQPPAPPDWQDIVGLDKLWASVVVSSTQWIAIEVDADSWIDLPSQYDIIYQEVTVPLSPTWNPISNTVPSWASIDIPSTSWSVVSNGNNAWANITPPNTNWN